MQNNKQSKKWLWVGLLIALFNPILSGLIISLLYLSEQSLKREGRIIFIFSIVWGAIVYVLVRQFYPMPIM